MRDLNTDIVVIGAGPTGMAASLEAARLGFSVAFVAPKGTHVDDDARTTAIMLPGIDLLRQFGLWNKIEPNSAPLDMLRIVDGTARLLRSPTVDFRASELGEPTFGYNIRNRDLNTALSQAVQTSAKIALVEAMASTVQYYDDKVIVTTSNGQTITSKLAVGADGVHSIARKSACIDSRQWSYPQTAIVLTFAHTRPHHNISTEFHTEQGPFTQVPLPGDESSLVWVQTPQHTEHCLTMDDNELSLAIERGMSSMLGKIKLTSKPQTWPLSSKLANRFAGNRLILVGHAAHAFPPIGAQGLNLGLRDIADFGTALASHGGNDPGVSKVTNRYQASRRADIWSRTTAVDLLNRSLLTDFLPVQAVRAIGLSALKHVPPLRTLIMREGMMPGSSTSPLRGGFSPFRRQQKDQVA